MEDKGIKVLIDLGVKYTKIGLVGEEEPRKILPTPPLFNEQDYFEATNQSLNMISHLKDNLEAKLSIEEFAYDIMTNNFLQVRKTSREKNIKVYLLIDTEIKDQIKEIFFSFIKYIFMTFPYVISFKILPKNICPIFVSSFCSGLILNCGFLYSTITVVDNGISLFSKHIGLGSCDIQKFLYKLIINDKKSMEDIDKVIEFRKKLALHIDDILVRISYVMSRKVSEEFAVNVNKYKDNYTNIYFYKDLPSFKISFNSRIVVGEEIFGKNENNLAFLIIKTLKENVPCEIRKKIASNIILSGGMSMLNGFYQRMIDELSFIVNNNKEFENIKCIGNDINVHKIIFPRNCLAWIGASLLLNFDNLNFEGREVNRKENENINSDVYDMDLKRILGIK